MTPLSTTLSLCRSSLAHARMAMLRAADRLEADPALSDRLRVMAESLEVTEVTMAFTEARARVAHLRVIEGGAGVRA